MPRSRRSGDPVRQPDDPLHEVHLVGLAAPQERAPVALDDRHLVAGRGTGRRRRRQRPALPQPVDRERALSAGRSAARRRSTTRASGGRPPSGSEVEAHPVVEHHAARRCEPRRPARPSAGVVDPQPPARVRQQHAAAQPPRGRRRRPRRATSVRGAVVEQQTRSVSAIAPADQATTTAGSGHREQLQHVQQHADVAARDDQRRRRARASCGTSARCPATAGPLRRPPRPVEGAAGLAHPGQVPLVHEPDDGLGVGQRARGAPASRAAPRHLVQRPQRVVELRPGRAPAARAARPGAPARRRRTRGRGPSTSSQRACSREVDAAAAEQRVELGVVGLALLPARGDRRDRARQVERPSRPRSSVGRRCGPEDR